MLIKIIHYLDRFLTNYYQKKIINKLNLINFEPKIILDIGAHLGEVSEFFIKNFKYIKKIYLFEPQKEFFFLLKRKFLNNSKVTCFNKACSNKTSESIFNIGVHRRSSTLEGYNKNSFYYKIKSILIFGKIKNFIHKRTKINTISLDSFLNKKKISVDLLKLDVEGSELKVLKGCEKNIKKIKVILIEILNHNLINNYSKSKIFSFLEKNNFSLYIVNKFPHYRSEDRIYINNKFFKVSTKYIQH
jgi:FkbM family methyltransferase